MVFRLPELVYQGDKQRLMSVQIDISGRNKRFLIAEPNISSNLLGYGENHFDSLIEFLLTKGAK